MILRLFVMSTAALLLGAPTLAAAEKGVLIISHEVADVGEWKKRFEGSRDARKQAGLTERFVMLDANKPNTVIVILEAGSAEAAKKCRSRVQGADQAGEHHR